MLVEFTVLAVLVVTEALVAVVVAVEEVTAAFCKLVAVVVAVEVVTAAFCKLVAVVVVAFCVVDV